MTIYKIKHMKKILLILIFIFISCNNLKKNEEVDIKFYNNLPIVNVKINNIDCKFLLDTGSNISFVDFNQQKILDFKPVYVNDTSVEGVGGSSKLYGTTDIVLTINNKPIDLILFTVNVEYFKSSDIGIVGILGNDYLINNHAIIDYKNKKIILNK